MDHENTSSDSPVATSQRPATPWSDLLSSAKLKASGLKIETLAEQVGVSAAYLRLLRQGKRSASTDTAERLLTHLGLEVETKPNEDGAADVIADDGKGNVVVVSTKTTRAGRPSVMEKRLEELLRETRNLQYVVAERIEGLSGLPEPADREEGSRARREETLLRSSSATPAEQSQAPDGDELSPAWRLSSMWRERSSHSALPPAPLMMSRSLGSGRELVVSKRSQVERLLRAVPDQDLPLAAAYLALLVERSQARDTP